LLLFFVVIYRYISIVIQGVRKIATNISGRDLGPQKKEKKQ